MLDMLIANATVLLPNAAGVRRHTTVGVSGNRIAFVRPTQSDDMQLDAATRIDGTNLLVMPGLVDCHTHTGQQLLRGRVLDELPMIWTRIMLPFESTLTPELMRLSAKLCALEMIKSGTTGFVDAGSYFMDEAAAVYADSGLRGVLSLSTMDQPGLPDSIATTTDEAVSNADAFYERWDGAADGRVRVAYALRALMSCSEELIVRTAHHAAERGALLQAHMNEYAGEINHCLQHHRMRPFEYLNSLGVLSDRFLGAHCLMLGENEKNLLVEHGVKTCHCPFSNCGKAAPETPSLRSRGVVEGLGSDGAAHGGLSLWAEMRLFRSIMNVVRGIPIADPAVMPADVIVNMATVNGCTFMGLEHAGVIEPGAVADLITVDLRTPGMYPSGNIVNSLVECASAADVRDMIVDGRLLMRDRQVLTLDEQAILSEADDYQAYLDNLAEAKKSDKMGGRAL
ncbi:amidohydrolase family protein [Bifidobacterium oedipodis]|uniref:Amidohydrolase n=1 Tax=Bifidobacterium oedipodis TaxID=2675322 RepID=A0A7Y0HRQ8_9BIFI|nr:amidohydrolase [Bifidobacterium sp. DSM 109957]NMM94350.1 amidohydrolase [Bifidobacterium sp. DSM 109957]